MMKDNGRRIMSGILATGGIAAICSLSACNGGDVQDQQREERMYEQMEQPHEQQIPIEPEQEPAQEPTQEPMPQEPI